MKLLHPTYLLPAQVATLTVFLLHDQIVSIQIVHQSPRKEWQEWVGRLGLGHRNAFWQLKMRSELVFVLHCFLHSEVDSQCESNEAHTYAKS